MFKRISAFGIVLIGIAAIASPAFAHVTVHPSSLPQGASDVELAFRVPNEEDNATTNSVQVFFPTDSPVPGVAVRSIPGWSSVVNTTRLKKAIKTDDGEISAVVSQITWTATPGSEIQKGQYQDFNVAVGQLPENATGLTFKVLQTYNNGDVVRWIQQTPPNGEEPEHPAPVLKLSPPPSRETTKDTPARVMGIVGIVVGGFALIIAVFRRR